ncbi:translational GTPase TypA [Rickettsiales bacterium]|nr:translational GTPase TypA [Rickettsiales bacterium]
MKYEIRNVAIIAHVDHGKTTIIDKMLSQSGAFRANQNVEERVMDSNDLEKERGITILAKCTSIMRDNIKINVIDTPGHADFGGEVERVLSMADGVILLVDAAEGPMPQTKFVLSKALAQGLRPIVVINKVDRPDGRPDEVIDEVFDLFVALDANEDQLEFPILYASGRDGWCASELSDPRENLDPLFNMIISHVPKPDVDHDAPFSMLVTLLGSDSYLGRILTGKVYSGVAKVNMGVKSINLDGKTVENGRLTKLQTFEGINRVPAEEVQAGDIVAIAGMATTSVADTICDTEVKESLPSTPIDPPTMAITLSVNDSPYAGLDGSKVTSRMIRDRLLSEVESNVAITVKATEGNDAFEVGGRGELQLGVLIETMRREGFEMSVSRPRVLFKEDESGNRLEPIEEVVVDVDDEYSGCVVEKLNLRKAEMKDMRPSGVGKVRIVFHAPSRGLIGYQSEFLTDTRGTGIMNRLFHSYAPYKGNIEGRRNGALISTEQGEAVGYAIFNLQDRGIMFISPQDKVYVGMIVGEHSKDNDLEINVLKGKQLTNVRASGSDENIKLVPPKKMTLEEMMSYIQEDELVEVTPHFLRLRKSHLDPNERKKQMRAAKKA